MSIVLLDHIRPRNIVSKYKYQRISYKVLKLSTESSSSWFAFQGNITAQIFLIEIDEGSHSQIDAIFSAVSLTPAFWPWERGIMKAERSASLKHAAWFRLKKTVLTIAAECTHLQWLPCILFRCVLAILWRDLSVRPFVRPSVGDAFVKNRKNQYFQPCKRHTELSWCIVAML